MEKATCTDCKATEDIERCTRCKRPVCPAHRSGTGRLADGYQCSERMCWYLSYRSPRFPQPISEKPN